MEKLVYDQAVRAWKKIAKYKKPAPFKQDIDVFKKMLDIFQIGDYFFVIFNVAESKIEYCDPRVYDVLGYNSEIFTVHHLLEIIHPDDLPVFLENEELVGEFFRKLLPEQVYKYKVRYDYRVLTDKGVYKRLMQQVVTIQSDDSGAVLRTIAVFTDIGYLKKSNVISLSFLGMDGEPSFLNYKSSNDEPLLPNPLSKRELEVLRLISKGLASKEIAIELSLSVHTVKNHRKNMLRKTEVAGSTGLLAKALENLWI